MSDRTRHHTNETEKPPRRIAFLLRMWCEDENGCANWRASLEMPGTGKRIGFSNLEQLFMYLVNFAENRDDVHNSENVRSGQRK